MGKFFLLVTFAFVLTLALLVVATLAGCEPLWDFSAYGLVGLGVLWVFTLAIGALVEFCAFHEDDREIEE